jgi:glutaredoxin-related protein
MKQKTITITLILIIMGLMAFVVVGSKNKTSPITENFEAVQPQPTNENAQEQEISSDILYWGTTCPHCHDTIEWIEENKVEEKLTIIRKEVYENQTNALELSQKAKKCGIDENNIGVPLMYTTDERCLVGTPNIANYLKEKLQ